MILTTFSKVPISNDDPSDARVPIFVRSGWHRCPFACQRALDFVSFPIGSVNAADVGVVAHVAQVAAIFQPRSGF